MDKKKRIALTQEEMEQVTAGLIVDTGDGWYYVVDDSDGFIYTETNVNRQFAEFAAGMQGQSKTIITPEEFKQRFGRDFTGRNY